MSRRIPRVRILLSLASKPLHTECVTFCGQGPVLRSKADAKRFCVDQVWGTHQLQIVLFTQRTRSQERDATSGMDWTIFFLLFIGRGVKFDARASKFLTLASKKSACMETPQSMHAPQPPKGVTPRCTHTSLTHTHTLSAAVLRTNRRSTRTSGSTSRGFRTS